MLSEQCVLMAGRDILGDTAMRRTMTLGWWQSLERDGTAPPRQFV
jgi:hypothetical protein